ncbi:hypothetical protein FIU89_15215 [Roseovarius sp. THAF27]|nr:hypothetical protein FIU89_15215 [Roseovarius sp. THAF27]
MCLMIVIWIVEGKMGIYICLSSPDIAVISFGIILSTNQVKHVNAVLGNKQGIDAI